MEFVKNKESGSRLVKQLLDIDKYSISAIATNVGCSRAYIYKIRDGVYCPSQEVFEKLMMLRGRKDTILYDHFVKRLKQFNPVATVPDTPKKARTWIACLDRILQRLDGNEVETKRLIDFCMSTACYYSIVSPTQMNNRLDVIYSAYRKYTKTSPKEIAITVIKQFLKDHKKFYRTDYNVVTHDPVLANAVRDVGGCNKIAATGEKVIFEDLVFAYLRNMKNYNLEPISMIKNGTGRTVTLANYREDIQKG